MVDKIAMIAEDSNDSNDSRIAFNVCLAIMLSCYHAIIAPEVA